MSFMLLDYTRKELNKMSENVTNVETSVSKGVNKAVAITIAAVLVVAVAVLSIFLVTNSVKNSYGYQDVLTQLKNGEYTPPADDGEVTITKSGWIVDVMQIDSAEESIQKIAKTVKDQDIKVYLGYKVDTNNKTITYAFQALAENGYRNTVYVTQGVNKSLTHEVVDGSEIDTIFMGNGD